MGTKEPSTENSALDSRYDCLLNRKHGQKHSDNFDESNCSSNSIQTHKKTAKIDTDLVLTMNHMDSIESRLCNSVIPLRDLKTFSHFKEIFINRFNALHNLSDTYTLLHHRISNPEASPTLEHIKSKINILEIEIQKIYHKINKLVRPDDKNILATPIYGENNQIPEGMLDILPTIQEGSDITVKLLWDMISNLITSAELSPQIGKIILSAKIQGKMIKTLEIFSDISDPREIAIAMSSIYDTQTCKSSYLQQLHVFERLPNESIYMAMSRLISILYAIEKHSRAGERKLGKENILRNELRKMVSDTIWRDATAEESKALRKEIPFNFSSLLSICDSMEHETIIDKISKDKAYMNHTSVETNHIDDYGIDSKHFETSDESANYNHDSFDYDNQPQNRVEGDNISLSDTYDESHNELFENSAAENYYESDADPESNAIEYSDTSLNFDHESNYSDNNYESDVDQDVNEITASIRRFKFDNEPSYSKYYYEG